MALYIYSAIIITGMAVDDRVRSIGSIGGS